MELLVIFGVVYFLPPIVAYSRRHRNAGAIFVMTILLGWTAIGWVVALIWASTANTESRPSKEAPPGGLLGMMERRKAERQTAAPNFAAKESGGLLGVMERGDDWRGLPPLPDDERRQK